MRCCCCFNAGSCDNCCCNRFFPEYKRESTWIWLGIRTVVMACLTLLLFCFWGVEYQFFGFKHFDWFKIAQVLIFLSAVGFWCIIYGWYQRQIAPLWFQMACAVLYFGTLLFFLWQFQFTPDDADRILDPRTFKTNASWLDLWTLNHAFVGILFGLLLPFVWMLVTVIVWELIEMWVFNDSEVTDNAIMDVVAAVIGWWIVILIFSRKCIPWISSMRAYQRKMRDQRDRGEYADSNSGNKNKNSHNNLGYQSYNTSDDGNEMVHI